MSLDAYTALTQPPQPGQPVVFAFHGTGADETQFAGLVGQMLPGAGLVAPRGDVSEHGAARYFRRTGEGVYDMEDLAQRTEKLAGFVDAHRQANPGAPVYGFGYSNGANILAAVAFRHPSLFDRIGLLHPLIPWRPEPQPGLSGVPVLVTAGRNDPICPWPMTESLIAWFDAQGANVTTALHEGGHEVRQHELQALSDFLQN